MVVTDENKELFKKKVKEVKKVVKQYAKEGEKLIEELKEQ